MLTKSSPSNTTQNLSRWAPALYAVCMALVMLGYVRYAPYQTDWDGVTYMDIASSLLHGRWHEAVNAYWGPGYPALLALGKWISHADRMRELRAFYFVNACIILFSVVCASFFVQSLLRVRTRFTQPEENSTQWTLSSPFLYLAAYALLFSAWLNTISPDNVRVDGLYASLILLAFGCLLRMAIFGSMRAAAGTGFAFGAAYLVKSPAFILAMLASGALLLFWKTHKAPRRALLLLFTAMAAFAITAGPYIAAISLQKHRLDFGDSGRLNYAWCVSGTGRLYLLDSQPWRFGHASVHLIHPETELLANPAVLFSSRFPHATYPLWFDPSYWNDGVHPHFSLWLQLRNMLAQTHPVLRFIVLQGLAIAALACCFLLRMCILPGAARQVVWLLTGIFLVYFALFLLVHFEDRYVLGPYWAAWIGALALLSSSSKAPADQQNFVRGLVFFFAISVAAVSLQTVLFVRETALWNGQPYGWYNLQELHASQALRQTGVLPDAHVACFRACDSGAYWARLASVHVTAEIYDTRYMTDASHPSQEWHSLPNKPAVLDSLRAVGIAGIVGRFNTQPAPDPSLTETWQHLAGNYYWLPTQEPAAKISGTQTPVTPQPAAH